MVGIGLGPVLPGYVMGLYKDNRNGMIAGYRVVLLPSVVIFVFFLLARAIAKHHIDSLTEEDNAKLRINVAKSDHRFDFGQLADINRPHTAQLK